MRARLTSGTQTYVELPIGAFARCVSGRIAEVAAICGRALSAAHAYEQMKPMSDAALAARGLTRADLPRAAYEALTRWR